MIKKVKLSCIFSLVVIIITSCGPELTPCGCKNSTDSDYQERCANWMIGASHEEYVSFKAAMNNCGSEADLETEIVNSPEEEEPLDPGLNEIYNEDSKVSDIENNGSTINYGVNKGNITDINQDNWTLSDKKQWIGNCIAGVNSTSLNNMPLSFKEDYCSCMLEKLIMKYPSKSDNVNNDLAKEFAKDCLREALK
jgi:hypothetical protein